MSDSILKNKKVLVVDDDDTIIDIVVAILQGCGAEPYSLNDGAQALRKALCTSFDAIILDRHMSDVDGHDVLKSLKADPGTKNIPVIMLTGETRAEEIQESLKLGISGYITKPFTPKNFIARMNTILAA